MSAMIGRRMMMCAVAVALLGMPMRVMAVAVVMIMRRVIV